MVSAMVLECWKFEQQIGTVFIQKLIGTARWIVIKTELCQLVVKSMHALKSQLK